ncbi:MAG: carboxypeptidase, partial [Thermoanaerobaculia bacterium]
LFIPILSVDAHERASRFSRINQRGPEVSGWRTNARNLNLNRDYAKADTIEIRALIAAVQRWDPDLYLDLHVTDGADYQYDITWGFNTGGWSPAIGEWLSSTLTPKLEHDLAAWGHIPGPLIFNIASDFSKGISGWTSPPRFSTGYGDAIHLPTVLVENHSLKPYRQRVLGTYVLLRSTIESVGDSAQSLRAAIDTDMRRRAGSIPLSWRVPESGPQQIEIEAIRSRQRLSEITGSMVTDWLGEPETITVDFHLASEVATSVTRPKAWWVPPAWPEVIERLDVHGIRYERISAPREVEVEMYRLVDPKIETSPMEGHVRVGSGLRTERRTWRFPANSLRVPADQPLGTLAALLLEPGSGDSLFQWGFMLEPLSRTEYVEAYVMEPMARRMLEANPSLRAEFEEKLESDVAFRGDPNARLRWFYEKTPWLDERWRLYPIAREIE